jgi:predicted nucleotidyltransferase
MIIHMHRLPVAVSETTGRVLALLSSVAGQELHTNEIIRRTGSLPAAVQRALTRSEARGLIQSRRVGNLRLWRMDPTHPLYAAMREMFARTYGVPAHLADVLRKDQQVLFAFLFGSYVTAQDDATSDIDLFVVGGPDWVALSAAIREAAEQLGREVRPIVWSEEDLRQLSPGQHSFLDNVMAGPTMWLVGDRSEFERRAGLGEAVGRRRRGASAGSRIRGGARPTRQGARSHPGREDARGERKPRKRARLR